MWWAGQFSGVSGSGDQEDDLFWWIARDSWWWAWWQALKLAAAHVTAFAEGGGKPLHKKAFAAKGAYVLDGVVPCVAAFLTAVRLHKVTELVNAECGAILADIARDVAVVMKFEVRSVDPPPPLDPPGHAAWVGVRNGTGPPRVTALHRTAPPFAALHCTALRSTPPLHCRPRPHPHITSKALLPSPHPRPICAPHP